MSIDEKLKMILNSPVELSFRYDSKDVQAYEILKKLLPLLAEEMQSAGIATVGQDWPLNDLTAQQDIIFTVPKETSDRVLEEAIKKSFEQIKRKNPDIKGYFDATPSRA